MRLNRNYVLLVCHRRDVGDFVYREVLGSSDRIEVFSIDVEGSLTYKKYRDLFQADLLRKMKDPRCKGVILLGSSIISCVIGEGSTTPSVYNIYTSIVKISSTTLFSSATLDRENTRLPEYIRMLLLCSEIELSSCPSFDPNTNTLYSTVGLPKNLSYLKKTLSLFVKSCLKRKV